MPKEEDSLCSFSWKGNRILEN